MEFKYEYAENLVKGENQYESEYDLSNEKTVDAKYIHSYKDAGNPFIEALPKPWDINTVLRRYSRSIAMPSPKQRASMDEYELMDSVDALDQFRLALPFHPILEQEFHRALVSSYARRRELYDETVNIPITSENVQSNVHGKMVIRSVSDATTGFALLGTSGCGKSTAINLLLDHYPQVIRHASGTFQETTQVVYLVVNCIPNSNFSEFYASFGRALDQALGNINSIYEQEIRAQHGLGAKYAKVRQLIEIFHIGILLIDEIELMDLKSTKENSYESLMTMTNETGIALGVIGTSDAYSGLFNRRRTARRTGVIIPASFYCSDKTEFQYLLRSLSLFQWADHPVSFQTDDMVNAMFSVTKGIISDLIGVYKQVWKEYLKAPANKKPEINADFIYKVAGKYFQGLQNITAAEGNPILNPDGTLAEETIAKINSLNEQNNQREAIERYNSEMQNAALSKYLLMRESVVQAIRNIAPKFQRRRVEHAFDKVMHDVDIESITSSKAIELTSSILAEEQARKKAKAAKKESKPVFDTEKARQELLDSTFKDADTQ